MTIPEDEAAREPQDDRAEEAQLPEVTTSTKAGDDTDADESGTGYTDTDKTLADSFPASDPPSY